MTEVSRNELYARDERGPEWFNDFLKSLAEQPSVVQDIMSVIQNKRSETVDGVVQSYREQVGLDLVQSLDDHDKETVKQASTKDGQFRPLSVRHAAEQSLVDQIKSDPEIISSLESLCRHSGGTKKIQSLISFLREKLGNDISFSDQELRKFLEEYREEFKEAETPDTNNDYVGLVGVKNDSGEQHDDDLADYVKYDGTV